MHNELIHIEKPRLVEYVLVHYSLVVVARLVFILGDCSLPKKGFPL